MQAALRHVKANSSKVDGPVHIEPSPATNDVKEGRGSPARVDVREALIIGNDEGLELWNRDGSAHQTLSPGAAFHPRRIADDAVLALSSSNLAEGAKLIRISLQSGARETVAAIPSFACANAASDDSGALDLDVQDTDDYRVDLHRDLACLTVMDRNTNMANVQVQIRIELDSGRVQRWLSLGEAECLPPAGVPLGDPSEKDWCGYSRRLGEEPSASPTLPFDFDDESGWIRKRGKGKAKTLHLNDFTRELVSPSGRWLVLGGMIQEADYIHRSLVLFDRQDGSVYPVLADPGPWPLPLTAAGKSRTVSVPSDGLADVVGESDVRWLSYADAGEILVVDQLVVTPLGSRWAFEGELAQ